MKKRLIIHIGMHKTGTSSVQRYFSRNRAVLKRMGVCYPRSVGADGARQPKHAAIFNAISHEADYGVACPALGPSAPLIEATAAEIEAAPGRLGILSAEGLSGERPVFAEAMAPLATRFDSTVVVFVRRQDHWVESFYKQMVLSREVREARSFHEFLKTPTTQDHMDFDRIIGWWRSAFDDVRVFGFHPSGARRPLAHLLKVAGLPRPFHWLPFAHAHENPSPGADAVELVREWNENGLEIPHDFATKLDVRAFKGDVTYFTHDERMALLNSFDSGNQRLLNIMEEADHSCLAPNMTELGRFRERE